MKSILFRGVVAFCAFLATLVIGAIGITAVDLYLSGHGTVPLTARPLIQSHPVGVHLSIADAIVLTLALIVAVAAGATFGSNREGRQQ